MVRGDPSAPWCCAGRIAGDQGNMPLEHPESGRVTAFCLQRTMLRVSTGCECLPNVIQYECCGNERHSVTGCREQNGVELNATVY